LAGVDPPTLAGAVEVVDTPTLAAAAEGILFHKLANSILCINYKIT
jgi:hypothetical protein